MALDPDRAYGHVVSHAVRLTPDEGLRIDPGDAITVALVRPWWLRWRPSVSVTFYVDGGGRLHATADDFAPPNLGARPSA
jgi:hypothetical protein